MNNTCLVQIGEQQHIARQALNGCEEVCSQVKSSTFWIHARVLKKRAELVILAELGFKGEKNENPLDQQYDTSVTNLLDCGDGRCKLLGIEGVHLQHIGVVFPREPSEDVSQQTYTASIASKMIHE